MTLSIDVQSKKHREPMETQEEVPMEVLAFSECQWYAKHLF